MNSNDQHVSWGELQAKLGKNIVPCFLLCSTSVTALRLEVTDSLCRLHVLPLHPIPACNSCFKPSDFEASLSRCSPLSQLSLQNCKKKIFHLSPAHFTVSAFGQPALCPIKPSQTSLASIANWEEVSPSAWYVIHPMTLRCNYSICITIT